MYNAFFLLKNSCIRVTCCDIISMEAEMTSLFDWLEKISVFSSYWFFFELKLLNIKHTGTKTFFSLRLSAQTLLLMLMHRKVWNRYLINYFKYKLGTLIILISIIDSFYPARFIDFYFSTHSYLLRGFYFSVDCAASTPMIV